MRNLPRNSRHGSIKHQLNSISIKNSRDTFLLKPQLPVTLSAITVPENVSINTWTTDSLSPSWTKQQVTDLVHSVSIYSESLSCILKSGKLSATSRKKIRSILSSLHQTVLYLSDILAILSTPTWTSSSGAGDQKLSSRKRQRKS